MRISFPCQPFCRDFIVSSSSSLFSFARLFQCKKQPLFIFLSTMKEGGIQAASSSTAQKEKENQEREAKRLQSFQLCFPVLKVTWLRWRIYKNTKSFAPPSAERAIAWANRMWVKKRVQSKQMHYSQPKVK